MNVERIKELVMAHEHFVTILANESYEDVPAVELQNKDAVINIIIGITSEIYELAGIPLEDPESCFKFIEDIKEAMFS